MKSGRDTNLPAKFHRLFVHCTFTARLQKVNYSGYGQLVHRTNIILYDHLIVESILSFVVDETVS